MSWASCLARMRNRPIISESERFLCFFTDRECRFREHVVSYRWPQGWSNDMPRDKSANHIKLMAAARAEFLKVGFEKASMRSIGERCGMTAAGLYRHCRDKEDLFDQTVSPAVERLNIWRQEHMERYEKTVGSSRETLWRDAWSDMMREVVYPHMEDALRCLDTVEAFFLPGWNKLLGI